MQTHLPALIQMLTTFVEGRPHRREEIRMDETERPELQPLFWITKWVDFQDKYGFGYCLSEGHYGVNFRDEERTVLNQNMNNLMYIDKHKTEHHYNRNLRDWPREGPQARPLTKKNQTHRTLHRIHANQPINRRPHPRTHLGRRLRPYPLPQKMATRLRRQRQPKRRLRLHRFHVN